MIENLKDIDLFDLNISELTDAEQHHFIVDASNAIEELIIKINNYCNEAAVND